MAKVRARKILKILRKTLTMPRPISINVNLFETLIATIISQNTSGKNTIRAFENLSNQFQITPEGLAKAEKSHIEESLKVAGLYRRKAKTIKEVSQIVLENFGGDLTQILSMPFGEARRTLIKLPGVGPKTADVVLLFSADKPTIPIDTHVNRVSKRLDLAPSNGNYEVVRGALQALYDTEDYLDLHILLISLGRNYCKARNPLCKKCPVSMYCPSKRT
jgi:endonuclease-3